MRVREDTWRSLIEAEMAMHGESLETVHYIHPSDLDLDREFDGGFGTPEGVPFFLWTTNRVYFATEYDGSESVRSVPRNPTKAEKPEHI